MHSHSYACAHKHTHLTACVETAIYILCLCGGVDVNLAFLCVCLFICIIMCVPSIYLTNVGIQPLVCVCLECVWADTQAHRPIWVSNVCVPGLWKCQISRLEGRGPPPRDMQMHWYFPSIPLLPIPFEPSPSNFPILSWSLKLHKDTV